MRGGAVSQERGGVGAGYAGATGAGRGAGRRDTRRRSGRRAYCSVRCSGNNTVLTVWYRALPRAATAGSPVAVARPSRDSGYGYDRRHPSRVVSQRRVRVALGKASQKFAGLGVLGGAGANAAASAGAASAAVAVTGAQTETVVTLSAGALGLKGARRGTVYAAEATAKAAAQVAKQAGIQGVDVKFLGKRSHVASALRGLRSGGIRVRSLREGTRVPHNGCRRKKARRV